MQQLWFDHLLALSMLSADGSYEKGLFVLLHPAANSACYRVGNEYEGALLCSHTFQRLTLEELIAALKLHSTRDWIRSFHRRYLEYDRVDTAVNS